MVTRYFETFCNLLFSKHYLIQHGKQDITWKQHVNTCISKVHYPVEVGSQTNKQQQNTENMSRPIGGPTCIRESFWKYPTRLHAFLISINTATSHDTNCSFTLTPSRSKLCLVNVGWYTDSSEKSATAPSRNTAVKSYYSLVTNHLVEAYISKRLFQW